jgi:hypothetical protein
MSTSGSSVYSQVIHLDFLENLLLTAVCNLLPVLIYVAFRRDHPDNATMENMKKALNDNDIDFHQLKEWNASCCRELSVG